jgi:uncharacterized membrane protein
VGNSRKKNGFVLIVTCIALTVLLGMAALGIDVGRMYVIKSELQAFTDAAALSEAMELDGGESGIVRAREAAARLAQGPNAMKWDMGTKSITGISSSFAKGDRSPEPSTWQAKPTGAGDYRFARVTVTAQAPLVFMRIFQPLDTSTVAASSVAAKTQEAARLIE